MNLNPYKIALLLSSVCFLITTGCKFNSTSINREEDNKIGLHYIDKFYNSVKKLDTISVDQQASDTLKKTNGPHGLGSFVHLVNKKLGNYKSFSVVDHYTSRIQGTNPETVYKYQLKVVYDRDTADELVVFGQKGKDSVKIQAYNVRSKLFLK